MILCPGQGGQHAGIFDLARNDPRASALLAQCDPVLGDPASMYSNQVAQPAIVASMLAIWEALRDQAPAPALVAGYSVGELAAYSVAGALAPLEAIGLATRRATLMDQAAAGGAAQALVAIGGLPLASMRALVRDADFEIAIVTGSDTCIAGGLVQRLPDLEDALMEAGARMQRLPLTVASHTKLMAAAVKPFAAALAGSAFGAMACPVMSGIGALPVRDRLTAIAHLSRQIGETILWSECMDAAAEAGITVALELGPGAALSRMLQTRHPGIACRSIADFRSLDGITEWLDRQAA
ncbi:MAG: acyltransferase domain-containing protein [Pseudomonadota bacterium]